MNPLTGTPIPGTGERDPVEGLYESGSSITGRVHNKPCLRKGVNTTTVTYYNTCIPRVNPNFHTHNTIVERFTRKCPNELRILADAINTMLMGKGVFSDVKKLLKCMRFCL